METAGPTPLRYYDTPKSRPRDRLDFRRPKRKPLRIWPFLLVVLLAGGAAFGLLKFMEGSANGAIVVTGPSVPPNTPEGG